jgi:hypothetical protein
MACFHLLSYGPWKYDDSQTCNQTSTCQKCGSKTHRMSHDGNWGAWRQSNHLSCQKIRQCQRCGAKEADEIYENHEWGEWKYIRNDSCAIARYCINCNQSDKTHAYGAIGAEVGKMLTKNQNATNPYDSHQWGEWTYDYQTGQSIRICRRCGASERK